MNKLVCGMVVDEELYMRYQDKKYRIGKEEYALRTIEIVATSKDYDAYPYLKAQAQGVVEQVQEEIREYYAARDGRKEYVTMKHNTLVRPYSRKKGAQRENGHGTEKMGGESEGI